MEKNYWVIRMGEGNKYADYSYENNLIAVGWNELEEDLSKFRNLSKKDFFNKVGLILEKVYKNNTKNANSNIAGQLFRFSNLMEIDNIVLVPKTQEGKIYIGSVEGFYNYVESNEDFNYQHRRKVKWLKVINIQDLSENLRKSIGAMMTIFSVNKYADEIENLLLNKDDFSTDENGLDNFGLESQLEDFIVENWNKLDLGKDYEILKENDEIIGQQYITPIGRIDILAKSKDKKEWLIIELKKGIGSDKVIGQTLRYIAWIKENEAENNQKVKGLIITKDHDEKLNYALKATNNIELMNYSISFKLKKIY